MIRVGSKGTVKYTRLAQRTDMLSTNRSFSFFVSFHSGSVTLNLLSVPPLLGRLQFEPRRPMSGNSATTSTPGYASLARGHDVYTHEDGADRAASVARSSELTLREASYYELPDVRQSIDADVRTLLSQGGVGLTTR